MAVEAVLLVPALMLIIAIIVQFALWAHAAQVAQLAASEGDRIARSQAGGAAAGVARAESIVGSQGVALRTVHVDAGMDPGDVVRISVSGAAVSIVPGISLPVSAAQSGPVQEFRVSG